MQRFRLPNQGMGSVASVYPAASKNGFARPARQCDNDVVDLDMGAGAYRLAEEGPGLGALQAVAYPLGEDALERTGHERQLEIHVDLHGYRRAEDIHVEEADGIRQGVLEDAGHSAQSAGPEDIHLVGQ